MYKKYTILLYASFILLGMSFFIVERFDELTSMSAFQMTVDEFGEQIVNGKKDGIQVKIQNFIRDISSKQRKITYTVLTEQPMTENAEYTVETETATVTGDTTGNGSLGVTELNGEDIEVLCRLVEAEAGGEDLKGKELVAHVVLNRMEHKQFPNSVEAVVFEKRQGVTQFSPVADGRFYQVSISDETRLAVSQALQDDDNAGGALYFVNSKIADGNAMKWFENQCTYLFTYGNHEFFS